MNYIQLLEQISKKQDPHIQLQHMDKLIHFMLQNIGSTNPKLRDELIYNTFCELILNDALNEEQLTYILETCIDNTHLFYHLDSLDNQDAVFTRSFSSLVIVLCLMKDHEQPYIQIELLERVMKSSYKYFINEVDYRGYIPHKGWAHNIAHSSDLLTQLIAHPNFKQFISVSECLNVIRKWATQTNPLIDHEHERIIQVITTLLQNGLSTNELSSWLTALQAFTHPDYYTTYRIHWNVEKLIQALYFELVSKPPFTTYSQILLKTFILKHKTVGN